MKIGDWLELVKGNENTAGNEDMGVVDVTKPDGYDTDIPHIENIPYHTVLSLEDIYDHFSDLINGEYRILNVNGISDETHDYLRCDLRCDYCSTFIFEACVKRCLKCEKNMCELCHTERTEQDAKKNGAEDWEARKDKLLACFEHEKEGYLGWYEWPHCQCDCCNIESKQRPTVWMRDIKRQKDICSDCVNTEMAKEMMKEGTWISREMKNPVFHTGFGSFLEWVPLLRDNNTRASLLYNIVPKSVNYHKVALSTVDDHGREGYFIYPGTLEEVLDKLKGKIPEYEKVEKGGWNE